MSVKERPLHARELPATRPGRFPIGRVQRPGERRLREEVAWDPLARDNPHCLVTGETGAGKSRLLEHWALQALDWDWRVTVLDIKGGGDFYVAQQLGATLIWNETYISDELGKISAEIDRRNAFLRETPVLATDSTGRMVQTRVTRLVDLPPSMRADLPLRLVIMDEAASLMWFGQVMADDSSGEEAKPKRRSNGAARKGDEALRKLRRAVQLARSAGIILVLALQRPDADFLPGAIKHNIGDRIMLGAPRTQAADSMMFDLGEEDEAVRHSQRGVGVALVQGCGCPSLTRVRVYLLDRDRLAPEWSPDAEPAPADGPGATTDEAPLPVPLDSSAHGAKEESWFWVEGSGPASGNDSHDPRRGSFPRSSAWDPPSSPARRALRRCAVSLRGPGARLRLRASASPLLWAQLADAPRTRSPVLRQAALERDGAACRACGATHRPLEVDHRVPLWASGEDTLENVWVLDVKCHKAKTRAEAAVRALKRRNGGRTPWAGKRLTFRLRDVPLLRSVYGWLYVAAFFTGLALPQYRLGALIGLAFVTIGVSLLSSLLGMSPKGGGLDRANSLDRKIESREPGSFGRVARTAWGFEKFMALLRLRLAISCALFAAGGFTPAGAAWAAAQLPL